MSQSGGVTVGKRQNKKLLWQIIITATVILLASIYFIYFNMGKSVSREVNNFPYLVNYVWQKGLFLGVKTAIIILIVCCGIFYSLRKSKKNMENENKFCQEELGFYQMLLKKTGSVIYYWDLWTDEATFSEVWKTRFGYEKIQCDFLKGVENQDFVHDEDKKNYISFLDSIKSGNAYAEISLRIKRKDGDYVWCKNCLTRFKNNKDYHGRAIGILFDIDKEKKAIDRFRNKAEMDFLTGVYNKGATEGLIQNYLAVEGRNKISACMIIDVDNFKSINDNKGHLFGDKVLSEMVSRLKKIFRSFDIIGRVGGDEFLIFMKNISSKEVVEEKAISIQNIFHDLSMIEQVTDGISASIGISYYEADESSFEELFKKADIALYEAKKTGKNGYRVYSYESISECRFSCTSENKF